MSENINIFNGRFKIVPVAEGYGPTSVNHTRPAQQQVRLGEPVDVWTIRKEGDAFRLSIGGYPFTRVEDNRLVVSTDRRDNARWIITYWELDKAYTIELASNKGQGWTITHDSEDHPVIEVRPIIGLPVYPGPRILRGQLFHLERVHD